MKAGLYIHVPFCRQACRYCDFFFTVSLQYQDAYVEALLSELEYRAGTLSGRVLDSLYLGGGTPSLLSGRNLDRIMEAVRTGYALAPDAEITVECNPDDLSVSYLKGLKNAGVNRLSIGIQSFHDRDLELMRRSHNAKQALAALERAGRAGFRNLTVDLIYGIPGQSESEWNENLQRVRGLPVMHVSAYHLTFEPHTVFEHWRKKGRLKPVDDELSERMYLLLRETLTGWGYEHYEISNFALEGGRSRHNQRYWNGEPYMGFGPSAHSYDGQTRSWNVASLKGYLKAVEDRTTPTGSETLTPGDRYHDALIMSLRTSQGVGREEIRVRCGARFEEWLIRKAGPLVEDGSLVEDGGRFIIPPGHWLMGDHIIRELFLDE